MRDGTKNNWEEERANFREGSQGRSPCGGYILMRCKG